MSDTSQPRRAEMLAELAREMQQLNGLSASFFRAVAARIGVTATDMQVIESLASTGPMTAGQLAELTGLTTGAITGMLNRLEEAGLVRRERDPQDGRRVIVQFNPDTNRLRGVGSLFESIAKVWEEQTAHYDDEQIAFLVDFLKRSNAAGRQELAWLREGPRNEEGTFSAPLGDVAGGQLVVSGAVRLALRAGDDTANLYQARFEGPVPEVRAKDGAVTIRYPRRLRALVGLGQHSAAEVTLSTAVPWRIAISGGGAELDADLGGLDLIGLEVKSGGSMIGVRLPVPASAVPVRISGAGSMIEVRRPASVAARVYLKGWGSAVVFDDQKASNIGSDVRLQSRGFDAVAPHYDIEIDSSGSMATIATL